MAFDFYGASDKLPATYCPVCRTVHYEITLFCAPCYRAQQAELRQLADTDTETPGSRSSASVSDGRGEQYQSTESHSRGK